MGVGSIDNRLHRVAFLISKNPKQYQWSLLKHGSSNHLRVKTLLFAEESGKNLIKFSFFINEVLKRAGECLQENLIKEYSSIAIFPKDDYK